MNIPTFIRAVLGGVAGAVAGLLLGAVVPLAFFYVFFMPAGSSWRNMDQVGILTLLTAPVGAIIGVAAGVLLFRRLTPVGIAISLILVAAAWLAAAAWL